MIIDKNKPINKFSKEDLQKLTDLIFKKSLITEIKTRYEKYADINKLEEFIINVCGTKENLSKDQLIDLLVKLEANKDKY